MALRKKNSLLNMANSYVLDSPQPSNLNYFWNFGSLLAVCLVIQIATGITLTMHYSSHASLAFDSVEHIMRDVNFGWFIRYAHANTASFFFMCIYAHMGRNMYYGSYKTPRVLPWSIGVIIFLLLIMTAFMGYVLVFGQMSLWGATVICNLLSAIPWLGDDIVQFLWGGFNLEDPYYILLMNNSIQIIIILKILLIAGTPFLFIKKQINLLYNYIYLYILNIYIFWNKNIIMKINKWKLLFKTLIMGGQSAAVRYFNTKAAQRLNARNLIENSNNYNQNELYKPYIVGLIEADGWISISKKGKYILYEVGIKLHIRDIQLLYKIKNILGVGNIKIHTRPLTKGSDETYEYCKYNISNKKHLIDIILPIFDKYPMLTNKKYDYLRFKKHLIDGTIYSEKLETYKRPIESDNISDLLMNMVNIDYLPYWLIGFIEGEGCFSVYDTKSGKECSFEISQTNSKLIIEVIKKYLNINVNVYTDKNNNSRLKITSVKDIKRLLNFMKYNPVKLLGHKKLQYIIWIKELRKIEKYSKDIKIPSNY